MHAEKGGTGRSPPSLQPGSPADPELARSKGRSPSPARLLRKEEAVRGGILNIPGAMTPFVVSKTETFSMQPVLTVPDGWPGRLPSNHLQITSFNSAAHSPVPA